MHLFDGEKEMKLTFERMDLNLRHTFRISRGAEDIARNVRVVLSDGALEGYGESAPSGYYGQNQETVAEALTAMAPLISGKDPFQIEEIISSLVKQFPRSLAAVSAVDIALHDLVAKKLGIPLYRFFGLTKENTPLTSFTIGIDTVDKMIEKVKEAAEYPVLKVKVGFENDLEAIAAIRRETNATIRVDANCAWTVEEAIRKIRELSECEIEFVEQPVEPGNPEALRRVRESVSVPIISDESSVVPEDVPKLFGCVDGINIKLTKCGGLRQALKMIYTAKSGGLKVMLGCMIESSISITAAAHLSPLADWADLDGNLLIKDDPFCGVTVKEGKLILPDAPGLGITPRCVEPLRR
jgi:L-alanine-DL-glutamate epimerase-like enolase superfamily enzyme